MSSGRAIAHPNIAIAKYWGKKAISGNIPAVPSLSVTLAGMTTTTDVELDAAAKIDTLVLDGEDARGDALTRAVALVDRVRMRAGSNVRARITSTNDFPTASGLASSASGFAALALAATRAYGLDLDAADVASLARESSASAARSFFSGFAALDTDGVAHQVAPPDQLDLRVLVCVTSEGPKAVGSTSGMIVTAKNSPFHATWLAIAPRIFDDVEAAIRTKDFERLGVAAEASAFAMHGAALAAGVSYFTDATHAVIGEVRALRNEGMLVFVTMDAGPHVKVLVLESDRAKCAERMESVPGVLRVIQTRPGEGAKIVEETAS